MMTRMDGGVDLQRPRGAVLRPLGLLLAAVLTGFGMWHVLMQDGIATSPGHRGSKQGAPALDRVAHREVP
jgi:hypothetical protein